MTGEVLREAQRALALTAARDASVRYRGCRHASCAEGPPSRIVRSRKRLRDIRAPRRCRHDVAVPVTNSSANG